jgi:2-amino-4-hydroxy-6-hydroxymethyldihydropteridine diphosphokinase
VTRAFLALGSNLGDRVRYLRDAIAQMPDLVATSRVYETEPVGGPDEQGPYLNMVARLETDLDARELLQVAHNLEEKAERRRGMRWGPRTLDVDVLWIDDVRVDDADLVVPHPRLFERAFVLAPLEDVAPDLVPAGWRQGFEPLGVRPVGQLDDLADER